MKHGSVAKDYVRLALAIDRHLPGYADSYYGPRAWRDEGDRSRLGHLDAERRHLVGQAFRATDGVYGNAVYLLHDRGKTDDEVAAYFQKFRMLSESEARRSVRVMRTQQLRTHYLSYLYGRSLLSALFECHDDAVEPFSRLLCAAYNAEPREDLDRGRGCARSSAVATTASGEAGITRPEATRSAAAPRPG